MIDPRQLEEILQVLREHDVSEFTCPTFSVVLGVPAPRETVNMAEEIRQGNADAKRPVARGLFSNPSLWPNGEPPRFPKPQPARQSEAFSEGDI